MEKEQRINPTEARAAEAILDKLLRITLPAPWLLKLMGIRNVSLWFRRPTAAQLLAMSAAYVRMGINLTDLGSGELLAVFAAYAEHIVTCSRIIAMGLIRSPACRFFFVRPLARYIRAHMDVASMAELVKLIVFLSGCENFPNIIRSIAYMKITAPALSHDKTES
jgi:hypothetical protein